MNNILDIIGPVMIGPSSSHTAGACRLGLLARGILGQEPMAAELYFCTGLLPVPIRDTAQTWRF
jgi:iron-sulfur-dependent L-serine dehydratase beta subunit